MPLIKKRTTLILGAGASIPYGFPSGWQLRNKLVRAQPPFRDNFAQIGRDPREWDKVQRLLRLYNRPSVDEFLAKYDEHAIIMKFAIAQALVMSEDLLKLTEPELSDNWYLQLLDNYLPDDPSLGGGLLTIVTFNYDLSLEQFMYDTVQTRYKLTDEQARQSLKALDIQHVYGQLGKLQNVHADRNAEGARAYGNPQANDFNRAAVSLATCFEAKSTEAVAHAQRQIAESECVAFLGFGYSRENMTRLDIKKHLNTKATVSGSSIGFADLQPLVRPYLHSEMHCYGGGGAIATTVLPALLDSAIT
jgi:hypothetical protein